MKVIACLVLLTTLAVTSGELLAALKFLHTHDVYKYMSADEQVLITELVAAAETCKLTALAASVGKDAIVRLVVHLPGTMEADASKYLQDHVASEARGTCVVDGTAPPPTAA